MTIERELKEIKASLFFFLSLNKESSALSGRLMGQLGHQEVRFGLTQHCCLTKTLCTSSSMFTTKLLATSVGNNHAMWIKEESIIIPLKNTHAAYE